MSLVDLASGLYAAVLLLLAAYGLHRSWLLLQLQRFGMPPAAPPPSVLPAITVQLPLYNERFVAQRLIDAVVQLDYPADRLHIQVLDDSTDETSQLVQERVQHWQQHGVSIAHITRPHRVGFKAGALAYGLSLRNDPLVAIFDADFLPARDFLLRCVGAFDDPGVGMVQARWGHLNADHTWLTHIQASLLDAHFLIEHASRHAAGHFFNFNGTAGIWRRSCIEDGGGWQHDTLTEDLDLSYRAQLTGWRFRFVPEPVVPAELPADMNAFKAQQRRWAKGSMQTGLKLLPRILRAPLPAGIRLEAFFHLTGNLCYLGVLLLALLMPVVLPGAAQRGALLSGGSLSLIMLAVSLGSQTVFYSAARRLQGLPVGSWLWRLPGLMAVGIGLSLSNALAVVEALAGVQTPFVRTPKQGHARPGGSMGYFTAAGWMPLLEASLGVWMLVGCWFCSGSGAWWSMPFLALFAVGFLTVAFSSVLAAGGAGPSALLEDASTSSASSVASFPPVAEQPPFSS